MLKRYGRNYPTISEEEQAALQQKRVLVAGCGGLGGYLIEFLLRMGVGEITAVDGDVFEESNLNRQLLSSEADLGKQKALQAEKRAKQINTHVHFRAVAAFLDGENAYHLVNGQDLVLDALDNIPSRLLLEDVCRQCGVTLVHGAISGWNAQVAVVPPGSGLLHQLYKTARQMKRPACPSPPPFALRYKRQKR